MAYTTIDNPELYFQSVLWTGNGSNPRTITFGGDENMQPDLLWYKCRSHAVPHILLDSVRGAGNDKELQPDDTTLEGGTSAETDGYISAFTSNGFTLAAGSSGGDHYTNEGSRTFVAWCWKAGGSTASNSSGDITSTVSVDTTAGFSITSYTGNNSNDQTVGHSLSAVPHLMIIKNRDDTNGWIVYHHKNTSAPETDYLGLNGNSVTTDDDGIFNDTAPTSTLFTIGDESDVGAGTGGNTEKIIAYLWSEKQGFSKFGSYTGNGNADGAFVYTGFRPAFVLLKNTASTLNWNIQDSKRDPFNPVQGHLAPNLSAAEADSSNYYVDFLSNGFKIRNSLTVWNESGSSIVYMAFAEAPFVNSNGVPCNAR